MLDRVTAPLASRLPAIALVILAMLAAVAAYAPGLSSPFVFDDEKFVRDNVALHSLWPPAWLHAGTQETRPLTNLSFALDIRLWGAGARGHHVTNLALHLASILLTFALVARMGRSRRAGGGGAADMIGAVAALFLALHPAHGESVLYIQGRPGLLATVFGLGAMLAAVEAIRLWEVPHGRILRTAAVAVAVALAALGKESGAVLPALVLLYDLLLAEGGGRSGVRARLVRFHLPVWVGLLPLALAYAMLENPHRGVFGAGVVDPLRFYITQTAVLLLYLRLYLWPAGLTIDRTFDLLSPADPRAWLAALTLLALLALVALALRRAPWAGFWALWFLAALAPTTLIPSHEFVTERYLTLASPAAAALAAWALARLTAWAACRAHLAPRAALVALALAVALPLGWAARGRAQVWRSNMALWREATRLSPGNARAWYQYARLLSGADSLEAAEAAVRHTLAIGTPTHLPYLLLSGIKASRGEIDSSVHYAAEAVRFAPRSADAHAELAYALMRVGRWEAAGREAEAARGLDPASRSALYLRGRARVVQGDLAGARADASVLSGLASAATEAAALRGLIEAREGRAEEADAWLSGATRQAPIDRDEARAYTDALRARAPMLLARGQPAEALRAWRRYFTVSGADRWDATSLLGAALALRTLGQDEGAASTFLMVTDLQPRAARAWIELADLLGTSRIPRVSNAAAARAALERGTALTTPGDTALAARIGQVRRALRERR